jgi:plastocyanin
VDPEQIYTEVLQEEQQKGSAAPVAEGRAKAARQRAIEGSPHPKEPKWWPGSQPHFEGGEAAPAEAAPAEEPVAEAEPEAAPEPTAAPEPAAAPAAEAPAADQAPEAPVTTSTPAPAPTPAPTEAPAAVAAAAEAPSQARPAGVTHGTPTGNRLRPEDGVSTEAQFEGQRAMYDRRKLIDEVLATGVSPVSAESAGRSGSPFLALMYLIIPIVAVFLLVSQNEDSSAEPAPAPTAEAPSGEGGVGESLAVTAAGVAFDTDTLTVPAGEPAKIDFTNDDSLPHNIAFYESSDDGPTKTNPLWTGQEVAAGSATSYETDPVEKPGEYYFQCDIHPTMNGTLQVE